MQTIKLDISAKSNVQPIYAKQKDVGREFVIELYENGRPYTVDDADTFAVWYSGPSGEGNYTQIGDEVACIADANKIEVEMILQMVNEPGDHEMCVVMYGQDNQQKGFWNIPYFVEAIPGADSEGATDYYNAFLDAQEKAEDAATRAEESAERAEAAADRVDAKPKDLIVTATFDTVISDTITNGTASVSAYDIAEAVSAGATVKLIDNDDRVYEYVGHRLQPNYNNAIFEAVDFGEGGYTTYRVTVNIEGQAGRTSYFTEFGSGDGSAENAVTYTQQDLTEEQKRQARVNIDAASTDDLQESVRILDETMESNFIAYTYPQNLDDSQKAQARNNIGAVGEKSLNEIRTKTVKEVEVGGSKNIFNPAAVIPNKTLNGPVIVDDNNGRCISEPIKIKEGETAITLSYVTGGGVHQLQSFLVVFYDSEMNAIVPLLPVGSTHLIPDNAAYFIVNLNNAFNSALHRLMVQYGDTMTAFEPYVEPQTVITEKVLIKNECLDFAEVKESHNQYNFATRTDDVSLNTDGTLNTTDFKNLRSVSDFIPCYGEGVFSVGSGAEGVYCFYDSNKTFISFGVFSNGAEGIAIPATASYVRVSFLKANALTFVLSFTETAMPYEKYGATYTSIESSLDKNSCKAVISDILATGGTIKFLGDSITQGVGGTGFAQDGEEIRDGWNVNTTGYCFANLFKTYIESKYSNSVINYGTKGVRSFNLVSWLAANDGYVTEEDKLLIVMIGTNNKWASTTDTLNDLKNDIQWIVDWCADKGKRLILVSAPMSTVEWDTQYSDGTAVKFHNEDIDHIYKEVAHKNNMDYVPMYQRMVEYCDLKDIDIATIFDDGLHPNDKGYYIMYKILMKELGLAYQLPNSGWDNASPSV